MCLGCFLVSWGEKRQKYGDTCPGVVWHTGSGVDGKKELTLGKNLHTSVTMVTRGHHNQLSQLTQDWGLAVLKPGWYQGKEEALPPAETMGLWGGFGKTALLPQSSVPLSEFSCVFALHRREGKAEAELNMPTYLVNSANVWHLSSMSSKVFWALGQTL